MPLYIYSDGRHTQEVEHSINESPIVACRICKSIMHRRPQMPNVNWNGLPPSKGQMLAEFKKFMNTREERRDKFAEEHEKHERRTNNPH